MIESPHPWADVVRVISLTLGVANLAVILVTVVAYGYVYMRVRAQIKAGEVERWQGLLPLHVTLIGASYSCLLVATLSDSVLRLHSELTWRMPFYLAAYALGFWALWTILAYQHRKVRDLRRPKLSPRR